MLRCLVDVWCIVVTTQSLAMACVSQDETSWVLAIKAALYWRVVGDAGKAITCLRVAYKHSPHSYVVGTWCTSVSQWQPSLFFKYFSSNCLRVLSHIRVHNSCLSNVMCFYNFAKSTQIWVTML